MLRIYLTALAGLLSLLFSYMPLQAQVFVRANAPGPVHDGSSWQSAFLTLQEGIDDAVSGDEVWVAAGTYVPTHSAGGDPDPRDKATRTFSIKKSISLYGGFSGNETQLSQRNLPQNPTILSGEQEESSYHVITLQQHVSVALDGFIVEDGEANGSSSDQNGAGLWAHNLSSLKLNQMVFRDNEAKENGGGAHITQISSVTITQCSFFDNEAKKGGGLLLENLSSIRMENTRFCANEAKNFGGAVHATQLGSLVLTGSAITGNEAGNHGGGLYLKNGGSAILTNNTFFENEAGNHGGGIYMNSHGQLDLYNSIFWENEDQRGDEDLEASVWYSNASAPRFWNNILKGSNNWPSNRWGNQGNNLDQDPLFELQPGLDGEMCTADDVLGIAAGSPALDAGNPAAPNLPTKDLLGAPRIQNGSPDIGASEGVIGGTFPVEWQDLQVTRQGPEAVLSWTTAQEINTSHFVVERATGITALWEVLGSEKAAGFSDRALSYRFSDRDLPAESQAAVHYRLRQIDLDGTFSYSPVVTLAPFEAAAIELRAYPNPSQGQLQVSLRQPEAEAGILTVSDLMGREVYRQAVPAANSLHLEVNLDLGQPGLYLLQWSTGWTRSLQRIVVE